MTPAFRKRRASVVTPRTPRARYHNTGRMTIGRGYYCALLGWRKLCAGRDDRQRLHRSRQGRSHARDEDRMQRRRCSRGGARTWALLMTVVASACEKAASNQGGAAWPHEPAGFTVITDWPFSALSGSGWSGFGGRLGVDPTAPASPPGVWQVLYPIGFVAGNSPGQENYGFATPLPTELFIGMWWRTSNPWQYQSVGDKIFYVTDITDGGRGLFLMQQGGAPHNLMVTTQTGAENRTLATVAQTPITLGVWHRIELYLKWSTTGTGVVRGWG